MNHIKNTPPVLIIIFNRPKKIQAVINALRTVKPHQLFVAADGPRSDYPSDKEKCDMARHIAADIDWECDVKTKFSDVNVGCDPFVVSAINWFFESVDRGIILEDDCVPHPHFFSLCSELLERYEDDYRIMQISALSPYRHRVHSYDYHFSNSFRCNGWATWRRSWSYFTCDLTIHDESDVYEMIKGIVPNRVNLQKLFEQFCEFKRGTYNNWDFFWHIACNLQHGLAIVPEKNLVKNIGFDEEGTHTRSELPLFSNLPVCDLEFPLRHPSIIYPDRRPEMNLSKDLFRSFSLKSRFVHYALFFMLKFSDLFKINFNIINFKKKISHYLYALKPFYFNEK